MVALCNSMLIEASKLKDRVCGYHRRYGDGAFFLKGRFY